MKTGADGQTAQIEIEDQGTGIAATDLPHIFDRFYRGDRARHREAETRGSGLGLSICRAIVATHGGVIEVTSQPGQGSRFCVILPLATTGPTASEQSARADSELSGN